MRLLAMSWLGSASELSQLVAVVASPAVAVAAIYADLYVDLIRIIQSEGQIDTEELWMAADTVDSRADAYRQSVRDRNPSAWAGNGVRVSRIRR
jgi:hypothetical protein